jgi:NADPH:quinone reductase-like Zn-dependent oxidoreductase
VDVVLDMVAGDYVQRNIDVLAMDGRLVMIGRQGGVKSEIDIMPILRKRLILTGSTLRARSVEEKGALAQAVHQQVWPLFESEKNTKGDEDRGNASNTPTAAGVSNTRLRETFVLR